MQIKPWFVSLSVLGVFAAAALWAGLNRTETVHYHAGFRLYVDGQPVDFSDQKYMYIEPCGDEEAGDHVSDNPMERAHLHDGVADVVHVHKPNVIWNDLFSNMSYKFDRPVTGYRDDQPVSDVLNQPITEYDRILFVVGALADGLGIASATVPTVERMIEVEAQGEGC